MLEAMEDAALVMLLVEMEVLIPVVEVVEWVYQFKQQVPVDQVL